MLLGLRQFISSPPPYEKILTYAEADGFTLVDVGVLPDDSKITAKMQFVSLSKVSGLFGVRKFYFQSSYSATDPNKCVFYANMYSTKSVSGKSLIKTDFETHEFILDSPNRVAAIDGVYSPEFNESGNVSYENFCIFARQHLSTTASRSHSRLYWMKVESGGKLIRHFVPVLAGGDVLIYDKVCGEMYFPDGNALQGE